MEHTKTAKNAKPTIKLSELNLTPIYIALLVVLISVGKFLVYSAHLSIASCYIILISLLMWFIRLVLYFLWKKKSHKRTDILVTGLCESGKTLMFSQLLHNVVSETFTSIAENVGEYVNKDSGAAIRVVDIPGHERLRGRFFDQYKTSAKGIVFVIDSVTVQKDIRDVAEYDFYPLLFLCKHWLIGLCSVHTAICTLYWVIQAFRKCQYWLHVINKMKPLQRAAQWSKLSSKKNCKWIIHNDQVYRRLISCFIDFSNLVRNTRQSQLQSVDNSTTDAIFLGKQGKDFEFGHLPQAVDVVECSSTDNNLDDIHRWLKTLS